VNAFVKNINKKLEAERKLAFDELHVLSDMIEHHNKLQKIVAGRVAPSIKPTPSFRICKTMAKSLQHCLLIASFYYVFRTF
jgi:hypothetical protein